MPDIFIDKNTPENTQESTEQQLHPEGQNVHTAPPHADTSMRPHHEQIKPSSSWGEQHLANISLLTEPPRRPGIFTSFAPLPLGVAFEEQEKNEQILLFARRHFVTNTPWILITLLLLMIPFIITPLFSDVLFAQFASFIPSAFPYIAFGLYYLVVLGFALNQFVTWFYQVGIVTNVRIIDVDFNSLLARNIAYTDIVDIVDTEAHQSGLIQGIYNYGTVGVQTAGMKANFEFNNIPKPNKVVDLLSDLMRDQKHHG